MQENLATKQKAGDAPKRLCPSAHPYAHPCEGDSIIFGVVLGTPEQPQVTYLPEPQPASIEMLAFAGSVEPDEVFRIASPCAKHKCRHFDELQCSLVKNAVQILPIVTPTLPACRIRPQCQWWHQEGKAACLRCPQVVTLNPNLPEEYRFLVEQKENDDV